MADMVQGFVVTLDNPIRDEDSERLRTALESMRGVQSVRPSTYDALDSEITAMRTKNKLREEILRLAYDL